MRKTRNGFLAALGCVLLAACGTGSPSGAPTTPGNFRAVVSFGDSLSDIGTYAPATSVAGNGQPPYFGGKFTTNNGTVGTVWVENLAKSLGIVITPAEVGFGGSSVHCPAAANPALAATCTAYAQGGSRITDPNGSGHLSASGTPAALSVPVVTQIAHHLERFGRFHDTDLIQIWVGSNDVFAQFGAYRAAAAQIQAEAAAGTLSADQAQQRLFQAQSTAQGEMKKAAQELAGYVRTQILAKGGKYVAVFNLPDSTLTPFGASLRASPATADAVPVLSGLVDVFNLWLRDSLTGMPVRIVDQNTPGKDVYANPGKYGLVNNTAPACDAAKISAITRGAVTDGSSLFCNATPGAPYNGIRDGADVLSWQFADGVHPTTGGHRIIGDYVTQQLRAFGWI